MLLVACSTAAVRSIPKQMKKQTRQKSNSNIVRESVLERMQEAVVRASFLCKDVEQNGTALCEILKKD